MNSSKTPFRLYPSTLKTKKYDIYVPKGDRLKKVSFGAKGYEDYTIHKDKERKQRYINRHRHDKLNDPYKAGFWAMYVLWNKPSKRESLKLAIKKAKRLIN
jgi:hypothetical protein